MSGARWRLQAYRMLLHLYPAQFRQDFEQELTLTFRDQLSSERTRLGRWACVGTAIIGILSNAPKEHLSMITTDLRYALRTFGRGPWFTLVAMATLALGIGVNSALFSVVKSVLVEALPYGEPGQLVRVWVNNPPQGFDHDVTSFPRFQDWKARSSTFRDFAGFFAAKRVLTSGPEPRQLSGAVVTPNFFRLMEVSPVLGRGFEEADDQQLVVVLSQGFWRREFGADSAVLGRQLRIGGQSFRVVGVLPETFQFPDRNLDFWIPLDVDLNLRKVRGAAWLNVVGRLHPGVSLRQAQAEMDSISKALDSQYVEDSGLGVTLVGLKDDLTGPIRAALLILSVAVICVLLICCANIAAMLAVRAAERERELSIRAALGAGRSRVVRQLLTEAILLFVCGGVVGIAVARLGVLLLVRLAPPELPQLQDTRLDLGMVAFTLVVSAVSGVIFGLRPAIRASRLDLVESLKQGGRSLAGRVDSHRFRTVLATGEIALAMVLLTAAGLLIRSFQRIEEIPLGFDPQHVSVADIQLPNAKYPKEEQQAGFYKELLAGLRNTPGIESVSATRSLLLPRLPNSAAFTIEGRPNAIATPLTTDIVTPEFFSTLKIPLLKGRFFNLLDHANSHPVAIINAATAERYWAREDPIGKRFVYGKAGPQTRWLTIVGVVADTKRAGLDQRVFTESYVPAAQNPDADMQIVIRTRLGVPGARSALQSVLYRLDPEQAAGKLMSLETALGERTASRRFTTFLLSLFAGTALAIAAVGVYGLISSMVAQRRQELGVRMALGALPSDVLRLVIGNVLGMAASGVVLGLIAALILSRGLESLLFGIGRFDPGSYALASFGLLCVCLAAAISPAIRALRVDPVTTLRME